jgi:hypothetical protein
MGQPVAVVEKPSSIPGVVRFEANRSLTGQGHERFASLADAIGPRPAAELARRMFATGKVENVHVYSNVITVHLLRGHAPTGLDGIVRDLYQYWRPGMEPPAFAEPEPEAARPAGRSGGCRWWRRRGGVGVRAQDPAGPRRAQPGGAREVARDAAAEVDSHDLTAP